MLQAVKDELSLRRKIIILEYAADTNSVTKTCMEFDVPRSTFYIWEKKFDKGGRAELIRKKPIPLSHPTKIRPEVIDKVLKLRQTYHFGPQRILFLQQFNGNSCLTFFLTLFIFLFQIENGKNCQNCY